MSDLLDRLARARALRAARAAAAEPPAEGHDPGQSEPEGHDPGGSVEEPPAVRAPSSAGPDGSRCRSCGAPIRWGIAPSGARVPLDAEPIRVVLFGHLEGVTPDPAWRREPVLYRNVKVRRYVRGREVEATELAICGGVQVPDGELVDLPRNKGLRSHFATCPEADRWRAKR